jgi:pyruvate/oxaloacetate carboxyltransferase
MTKLKITDTTLRDAHQSLIATRMRTTFDSMMRFLDEDPWERVEALRDAMPNTKFQMLLRASNVVGYHIYPDDVLEAFVVEAVKVGIDIFRIFDALNDIRNMEASRSSSRKQRRSIHWMLIQSASRTWLDSSLPRLLRILRCA